MARQNVKRAAYFDVDGTLTRTTIVDPLTYFRRRQGTVSGILWKLSLLWRGPRWLWLDARDRAASNRAIYACYAGMEAKRPAAWAAGLWAEVLKRRMFPQARARVEELRREGVSPVLLTGGLDFVVAPVAAELQAEVGAAVKLEVDSSGRFTGRLEGEPLCGERKAEAVREHARRYGIVLKESFAFGDAIGDLPMLEGVGRPTAVNPDRKLLRAARERGWPVETWTVPVS